MLRPVYRRVAAERRGDQTRPSGRMSFQRPRIGRTESRCTKRCTTPRRHDAQQNPAEHIAAVRQNLAVTPRMLHNPVELLVRQLAQVRRKDEFVPHCKIDEAKQKLGSARRRAIGADDSLRRFVHPVFLLFACPSALFSCFVLGMPRGSLRRVRLHGRVYFTLFSVSCIGGKRIFSGFFSAAPRGRACIFSARAV